MADRVFCIDFGSSFTKVALRTDPSADAQLVSPAGASSALTVRVPTVVAAERRPGGQPRMEFGSRAADMTTAGDVTVYRNWKKSLFLKPTADEAHHSPLEALLASTELSEVAGRFGVSVGQLNHLRQMVVAARGVVGGTARALSAQSREYKDAVALTYHYFKWLREQVLDACERLPVAGLKYEAIPVRFAVPAFSFGRGVETHPGCQALTDTIRKAGWPLHPEQPLVTEPYSNAVGVLTKGKNLLLKAGTINLGGMFYGPLVTVMRDPKDHPTYRALVIDVGAFTTDFARIELDTEGRPIDDPDSAFEFAQHSVPTGVSNLDDQVAKALPPEKAGWVRNAPGYDMENFRRLLYSEGKAVATNTVGRIGVGVEGEAVRDAIQGFCRELGSAVAEFCDGRKPAAMQELILTGGGAAIPAVRDSLQQAAQAGGNYVRTYAPVLRKAAGGPTLVKLDMEMTRGGSALGGTSIYFERSYNTSGK